MIKGITKMDSKEKIIQNWFENLSQSWKFVKEFYSYKSTTSSIMFAHKFLFHFLIVCRSLNFHTLVLSAWHFFPWPSTVPLCYRTVVISFVLTRKVCTNACFFGQTQIITLIFFRKINLHFFKNLQFF